MDGDDRSEKLALARKKLKLYQKRSKVDHPATQSCASLTDDDRQSLGRSCSSLVNHDDQRSPFQRVRMPSESSEVSSMSMPVRDSQGESHDPSPPNIQLTYFPQTQLNPHLDNGKITQTSVQTNGNEIDPLRENQQLKCEMEKQKTVHNETMAQFQQLHGHYTQLHSAYTNLSKNSETSSVNSKNDDSELVPQIRQLQQAMSVLVEEKTDLQSQLRQAMKMANEKHTENEQTTGRMTILKETVINLEKETDAANILRCELERALNGQKKELDKCRIEAAQWQARAIEAQQDRTELQARLKVKSRELDRLQAEAGDSRKQLHMKDIYIRQLTAAGATAPVQPNDTQVEMENVQRESDELRRQLGEAHNAVQHWQNESRRQQNQYETYGRDLNNRIVHMAQQLETHTQEKHDLAMQVERLSDAQTQNDNTESSQTTQLLVNTNNDNVDLVEEATSHVQKAEYDSEHRNMMESINEYEIKCNEYHANMQQLEMQLQERDAKLCSLTEEMQERKQFSQDSNALVEQLHAERITVSRAVAQNVELKEQLQELQDQFITMTESNMQVSTLMETSKFELANKEQVIAEKDNELVNLRESLNQVNCDKNKHNEMVNQENEMQISDAQSQVQALIEQNSTLRQKIQSLDEQKNIASQNTSQNQTSPEVEFELSELRREMSSLRQIEQRTRAENQELHRIMLQNDIDENQNSISVELQQALDRINALSLENTELRAVVGNPATRPNVNTNTHINVPVTEERGLASDESSLCSQQIKHSENNDAILAQQAMTQLEHRFKKAMTQNAELSEHNQHLQHLITQLQGETDTIGEYITIYQHRRQMIRDRLKQKEEALAKLAREKDLMQTKLWQLQELVMRSLQERGVIQPYDISRPSKGKHPPSLPRSRASSPSSPMVTSPGRQRTSSQNVVDEITGLQTPEPILEEPLIHDLTIISNNTQQNGRPVVIGIDGFAIPDDASSVTSTGTAEQIIRLLTEMQSEDVMSHISPLDRDVHCKDCSGKLIHL